MEAKPIKGYVVLSMYLIEGETIAILSCNDYDRYASLPEVIEVQGKRLGKAGWNSDTGTVCYKSRFLAAYPM